MKFIFVLKKDFFLTKESNPRQITMLKLIRLVNRAPLTYKIYFYGCNSTRSLNTKVFCKYCAKLISNRRVYLPSRLSYYTENQSVIITGNSLKFKQIY
jgi:hypothetical protein